MSEKVLLIIGNDRRKRYRFVQEPLETVGIEVDVKKPLRLRMRHLLRIQKRTGAARYRCVIMIGGGSALFLWPYLIVRLLTDIPLYVRVGGEPRSSRESPMTHLWRKRRLFQYSKMQMELWVETFILNHCDGCIAVSESLAREMQAHYQLKAVVTITRPVSVQSKKTGAESDQKSPLRLLSVTNLGYAEKRDGILKILRLLEGLPTRDTRIRLRIIGGGAYARAVSKMCASFCHTEIEIEYLGFRKDVRPHYRWADVFIYASELDSLGNVLLEAKSYGLPVIVHEHAPFRDVFPRGGALFFDAHTGDNFLHCLDYVLDSNRREQMTDVNRGDIESLYSPIEVGRQFCRFFISRNV